jgi:ATP adenylyltransferase
MDYLFNFNKLGYIRGAKRPDGCILCLVASGSPEVERLVVSETGLFVVSLNLYPYNPGHLLVFPRRHVVDVRGLEEAERSELDRLTRSCLDVLDSEMRPAGYNVGYNIGLAAGASIEHLHLHVIPRYPNEIGMAELLSGSRVLVQDPRVTQARLAAAFKSIG